MLKFGNKEFRNLQEQVKKNMDDIMFILQEEGVLNEFGIKVVGQEDSVLDMPTVDDYKEDNEDWAYGDAYAVGTEDPYELYILTRANGTHPNDYWFNIGEFPAPGPQGEQGPQGETGPQGPTGPSGQDGVSPEISIGTVSATTLSASVSATASVSMTGTYAQPVLNFAFGIPQGQDGSSLTEVDWGDIQGSIANQTDLVSALQGKANASALSSYATLSQLSEYALASVVSAMNYASVHALSEDTVIPSLSGYATESWVLSQNYASQTWVNNQLSEYAKTSALSSYALQSDLSLYATISAVSSAISGVNSTINSLDYLSVGALSSATVIPDITGLASETYVNDSISALSSIYAYASVVSSIDYASVGALSSGTYIPEISGTNDGEYWTSLTIDGDTYDIGGGASGDYVPVLVSEEDSGITQSGEVTNSTGAVTLTVDYTDVNDDSQNKQSYLDLYQDDVYLGHSYNGQVMVEEPNPNYDPEDPESGEPETITTTMTVGLGTYLYIGQDVAQIVNTVVDGESTQDLTYDLIDTCQTVSGLSSVYATQSWVSSNFLSSGYVPIISGYAELSADNVFTGSNKFNSVYLPYNSFWTYSVVGAVTTLHKVDLPSTDGTLALTSQLPSMSLYAELSTSNTFTASNYFTKDIYLSSNNSLGIFFGSSSVGPVPRIYGTTSEIFIGLSNNLGMTLSSSGANSTYLTMNGGHIGVNGNPILTAYINKLVGLNGSSVMVSQIASIGDIPSLSEYATISAVSSAISDLSSVYASISYVDALSSVYAPINYVPSTVSGYASEVWTFTLSDNTSVSKTILVG